MVVYLRCIAIVPAGFHKRRDNVIDLLVLNSFRNGKRIRKYFKIQRYNVIL